MLMISIYFQVVIEGLIQAISPGVIAIDDISFSEGNVQHVAVTF